LGATSCRTMPGFRRGRAESGRTGPCPLAQPPPFNPRHIRTLNLRGFMTSNCAPGILSVRLMLPTRAIVFGFLQNGDACYTPQTRAAQACPAAKFAVCGSVFAAPKIPDVRSGSVCMEPPQIPASRRGGRVYVPPGIPKAQRGWRPAPAPGKPDQHQTPANGSRKPVRQGEEAQKPAKSLNEAEPPSDFAVGVPWPHRAEYGGPLIQDPTICPATDITLCRRPARSKHLTPVREEEGFRCAFDQTKNGTDRNVGLGWKEAQRPAGYRPRFVRQWLRRPPSSRLVCRIPWPFASCSSAAIFSPPRGVLVFGGCVLPNTGNSGDAAAFDALFCRTAGTSPCGRRRGARHALAPWGLERQMDLT